tara:strand:- start:94 stop:987 length:894 start_codon:yes stop_codon:yes gene_type:complete
MANIYLGSTDLSTAALKLGSTSVAGAYLGGTLVWPPAGGFDPDAQDFFDAITLEGITLTTTEQNAVNQLALDLKSNNLWTKMDAVYPFVGSNDNATKYNLKDSADTDAAYRITWTGTINSNSSGVQPAANNTSYGLTNLLPSIYTSTTGAHMTVWCNQITAVTGYDMGAFRGSGGDRDEWMMAIWFSGTQYGSMEGLNYATNVNSNPVTNFYGTNNIGNSTFVLKGTTSTSISQTIGVHNWSGRSIAIGGSYRGVSSVSSGLSGRGYAIGTIGQGLTTTEIGNLYTIQNTYRTSLSR